jgi:serine/threonine protein kinase/WD40 repeat protein
MTPNNSRLEALGDADRESARQRLDDFQRAWTPELLDAWAAKLPPAPVRVPLLVALASFDLSRQWAGGHSIHVEDYLRRFPELGKTETVPVELIRAEFEARVLHDIPPDPKEFEKRFPGASAALLERLEQQFRKAETDEEPARDPRDTSTMGQPVRRDPGDLPETFGRYHILERLGRGGMGTVYLAHDTQLDRRVALKVPHITGQESPQVKARFFREARAAAALHHPHLCPVYDVGEVDGILYLTMPFVDGKSLSQMIHQGRVWPQANAAACVRLLALALADAHGAGVVHRDLKPSNVIVNKRGELIIMDFGLARRLHALDTRLTQSGDLLGTPAYMPPEQVAGKTDAMGPSCDIYSLGVMLYQLICGRLPYSGTPATTLAKILTERPPAPSIHRPDVDAELAATCMKAMAKEPADRYPSVQALGEALTKCLVRLGTQASGPNGPVDLRLAVPTGEPPELSTADMPQGASAIPHWRAQSPTSATSRRRVVLLIGAALLASIAGLFVALRPGPEETVQADGQSEKPAVAPDGQPEKLVVAPKRAALPAGEVAALAGHTDTIWSVALSPDGTRALSGSEDNTIRLWDLTKHEELRTIKGHRGVINAVAFLPDGHRAVSGSDDKTLRLWNLDTGDDIWRVEGKTGVVQAVSILPGGDSALTADGDRLLRSWRLKDGQELRRYEGHKGLARCVIALADGRHAVSAGDDRVIRHWDLQAGAQDGELSGHGDAVIGLAVSGDGKRLVSSSFDKTVRVWDLPERKELRRLQGHEGIVNAVDLSADGRWALTGGDDGTVRLWHVESGKQIHSLSGHTGAVKAVALAPDARQAVSGGNDGKLRLWRLAPAE